MNKLVPLLITAPLLVACGSDSSSGSDSNESSNKQPKLPQVQVKNTNNSRVNGAMSVASGLTSGLTTQLNNTGVKPAYNNNSGKETWTYSANGITLKLEYTDGSTEDTWKLFIDGKQGDVALNNWLAWQIIEQDSDDSTVVTLYQQNSANVSARISAGDKRAKFEQFNTTAQLVSQFVVIEKTSDSGRFLSQNSGQQVGAMIWSASQLTIYSNCGSDITAAETADLATTCASNQSQAL